MKDSVDFDLSYANNFDVLMRLSRSLADTVTEDGLRLRVERDPDVLIAALLRIVQRFSSQQRKCCKLSKNIATKHAHVRLDGHVHVKADAFKGFQAMTLSQQRTEKKYGLVLSRKVVNLADPAATRRWATGRRSARLWRLAATSS